MLSQEQKRAKWRSYYHKKASIFPVRTNETAKRSQIKNRKKLIIKKRNRYRLSKYKYRARYLVKENIKKGMLKREMCCICHEKDLRKIEGHHPDYSKPLEVIWLCGKCHTRLHKAMERAVITAPSSITEYKNRLKEAIEKEKRILGTCGLAGFNDFGMGYDNACDDILKLLDETEG